MTHTIQLDYSHEFSFGELLDDISPFNLTAQIVELCGPAGGNPLLSLTGTYDDIVSYLTQNYCEHFPDEIEYYSEGIRAL